jgi:hypothetical protein
VLFSTALSQTRRKLWITYYSKITTLPDALGNLH